MEISEVAENTRTLSGCVKACKMALENEHCSDPKKEKQKYLQCVLYLPLVITEENLSVYVWFLHFIELEPGY